MLGGAGVPKGVTEPDWVFSCGPLSGGKRPPELVTGPVFLWESEWMPVSSPRCVIVPAVLSRCWTRLTSARLMPTDSIVHKLKIASNATKRIMEFRLTS